MATELMLPNTLAQRAKVKLAFAFNRSYHSNIRNLEFRTYGAWTHILTELVREISGVFVVPQHVLWFDPDDTDNNPNSSFGSTATQSKATVHSRVPDWALVHATAKPLPNKPQRWKITHHGVPLFVEAKRAASRKVDLDLGCVLRCVELAQQDAITQAAILFQMHPCQKQVITIACAGEWWSCRVVKESDVDVVKALINLNCNTYVPSLPSTEAEVGEDPPGAMELMAEDVMMVPQISLSDEQLAEFADLNEPDGPYTNSHYLQQELGATDLTLPGDQRWSGLLQMGTRPSNQVWFLINRDLRAIAGLTVDGPRC